MDWGVTLLIMLVVLTHFDVSGQNLEQYFHNPPDSAKPWVFWFWINGNISREGITKDLEAMKRVGINGVLWMEVSGPWWAPQGPIEAGTKEWDEMMQWAISEADRLGMDVDLSVDFGYGCGGPHITPETSMQKLVWSEILTEGGRPITLNLKKPEVDYKPMLKKVWLRPGKQLDPEMVKRLEENDSYRDIAVFAVKMSGKKATRMVDKELAKYDGRGWKTHLPELRGKEVPAPIPQEDIACQFRRIQTNLLSRPFPPKGGAVAYCYQLIADPSLTTPGVLLDCPSTAFARTSPSHVTSLQGL